MKFRGCCTWIEDYKSLNISDLKRLGFLEPTEPGTERTGVITWTNSNGETTAKIQVAARVNDREQKVTVSYYYGDELRTYAIELLFTPSNLPNHGNHGYYYFLCPDTWERCRKLYLVNGTFVSRKAFKALYFWQTLSHKDRTLQTAGALLPELIRHETGNPRYRKRTYRGNLTPYGRKMRKWESKL